MLQNGTRFVVPKGWSIRNQDGAAILGAPEGDAHIVIREGGSDGADAAVAATWAAYRPGFAATAQAADRPAREGWDQTRRYRYESPDGTRNLFALALRKGEHWTVVISDLSAAVAERRDAQLEVIFNTLLPQGYTRETFAGRPAHRLDAARIALLTELIETARKTLDIPGVALGLVQDGKVVFEGGFGVRQIGRAAPVDARTLFNIASNGKALTTLMLARQVEAGRFDWNTPVASIWREFRVGDAETTRRVAVKHLICACTGMPRQDYEWMFEGDHSTAASMMQLLSTAQPTSEFGDIYQYSNLMAAAAGFFGGHVLYPRRELGAAYDAAMQQLVFGPLGMSATTADFRRALAGNHAAGHAPDIQGNVRIAGQGLNRAAISTRPSGNHWSNVRDLLRYVRMELANGLLPDGRRYIGEDVLLARREPQVTEGRDEYYGMGLKIDRQWGVPVIHHGGTAIGYRSDMIWLPDHGVGAVILINSDSGSLLRSLFRRRLLEVLFDGQPVALQELLSQAGKTQSAVAGQREQLSIPADAAAAGRLAPSYRSAELGRLDVRRKNGVTRFDFGGWSSEVATRPSKDGRLTFVTIAPGEDGFEFDVAERDGKRRLVVRDAQHEYEFVEGR
ncbi:serine hydrolase domain-containing protein [Tahibacter aquaticus]|uniref:serine hydrolase domain-containing protein n=1 Tax=Tahibacter aquaticus TaxID=520092 RepID=UPI001AADF230|nr:serine hydrolase domain-containing protein [Tahibacter aquaticus]